MTGLKQNDHQCVYFLAYLYQLRKDVKAGC